MTEIIDDTYTKVNSNSKDVDDDNGSGDLSKKNELSHCCVTCGKVYQTKGNLVRHMKYECGVPPNISCPVCGVQTKYLSSMKRHVNNRHPTLKDQFIWEK